MDPKKDSSDTSPCDISRITARLDALCEKHPFLSVTTLGTSLLGRRIPLVRLGDESCRRSVLYIAAHHASEWICSDTLMRFIEEYCSLIHSNAAPSQIKVSELYYHTAVYIVPMLNVDGVQLQQHGVKKDNPLYDRLIRMNGSADFTHWQANARGVDLNHNYNAGFEVYKKIEKKAGINGGAPTRFSGEYPESEPEIGYLCNFIRFNESIKAALTLHTQGEEIYYTSGDKKLPRTEAIAGRIAKMSGYTVSKPVGAASYGGMTDWMIQKMNKPSFTIECGKGENPLPFESAFEIYTHLRKVLFSFPTMV